MNVTNKQAVCRVFWYPFQDGKVELPLEARARSSVVDAVSGIRHTGGTTSAVSGFQTAIRVRDRKGSKKHMCPPRVISSFHSSSDSSSSLPPSPSNSALHDSNSHVVLLLPNPDASALRENLSNSRPVPPQASNQNLSSLLVEVIDIAYSTSTPACLQSLKIPIKLTRVA